MSNRNILLTSKQFEAHREFWAAQSRLADDEFRFSGNKLHVSEKAFQTARFPISADGELILKKLSRESDMEIFIVLLTALQVLLARYSRQPFVVVHAPLLSGTVIEEGMETKVPLAGIINNRATVKELITRTSEIVASSYSYHDFPVSALLSKEKNTLDTNVFLRYDAIHAADNEMTSYDLYISINKEPGNNNNKYSLTLSYNTNVFDEWFIQGIGTNYIHIVEGFKALNKTSGRLDMLNEASANRLIQEYNNNNVHFPAGLTLDALFETQVKRIPDAVAVVSNNRSLTYLELYRKANQLALLLRKEYGVGTGDSIAILLDRTEWMIISIMGILRAGGAYLPVEPGAPKERLKYMLAHAGVKVLVTAAEYMFDVELPEGIQMLVTDVQVDSAESTGEIFGPQHDSSNPAYIIYTSGSTGNPKAVCITHRSLLNTQWWRKDFYGFDDSFCSLQFASFTFDSSVNDIFSMLLWGGKLVILDKQERSDVVRIRELLRIHRVTNFNVVPSLYKSILSELQAGESSLRIITLAGEKLNEDLVKAHFAVFPQVRIVNEYGPTENAICSTACMITASGGSDTRIGKPVSNTQVYILDELMQPLPAGVAGEIFLSGAGLAEGYLNDPVLTAERFLAHPFMPGEKIYRSGDIGRWTNDGELEFLGREDEQVKIRGYRVELAEIENVLRSSSAVDNAVVIAHKLSNGTVALTGYLTGIAETELAVLKKYLEDRLPDYMIPLHFIVMDAIPLTANNKINRSALPLPESLVKDPDKSFVAPATAVEKLLVTIWEEVLGKQHLGTADDFFASGGDSIKAIQIAARMYRAGYKLEMKHLFENPVIATLAPFVQPLSRIPVQDVVTGPVPLTPIQKEIFLPEKNNKHHYNQSLLLGFLGKLTLEKTEAIFSAIQKHHDVLRMTFSTEGNNLQQYNNDLSLPVAVEEWTLTGQEGEITALCNILQSGIDLENGPLMKIGLLNKPEESLLFIVIHHLVMDAVSWRILMEDISTLSRQYDSGQPLSLPLKTDSFKYWAESLQAYANSETFLLQKKFWKEIESAVISPLEVDFSSARNENFIRDTATVSFMLTAQETELLQTKVHQAFTTEINDILLTALATSAAQFTGHTKLLVTLEGHGREEILPDMEISRTVGWFTSTYPLVIDAEYTSDPARRVIEVKESLRRVPYKGIGHGILKYLTDPALSIDFRLQPEISFNYLGQFDSGGTASDFEIVNEATGDNQSPHQQRQYLIEISGLITEGVLVISFTYNKTHYKKETIQRWADLYREALSAIIQFCSVAEKQVTPSDLTYKQLTPGRLALIQRQYNFADIYPLSPMQEGMLFHSLLDKSSQAYFEQVSYRLHGKLDPSLVERSVNVLFQRHSALRTVFLYEDLEQPLQVLLKERKVAFYSASIADLPDDQKEDYITAFKQKDVERSFRLEYDPLLRVSLLQVAPSVYEFIFSHHHIIMDGWCIGILISEYFEIYKSLAENTDCKLAPQREYKEYIRWLMNRDMASARHFWTIYLQGYNEIATLSVKKALPGEYVNEQFTFGIGQEKMAQINQLATISRVTLSTIVQSLWAIVLAKYSGKEEVVFGAVVSGRPAEIDGIETMVGLFINTIPVRIKIEDDTKLTALLAKVQREALEAEPNHYLPLAEIQSTSELKHNLFDQLVIVENFPLQTQLDDAVSQQNEDTDELEISNLSVFEQTSYDFNLMVTPGRQTGIMFKYNSRVYSKAFAEQLSASLLHLFDQLIENPETAIGKLTLLPAETLDSKVAAFNNTFLNYPRQALVHELFEKYAITTPGNTAIKTKSGQYSYSRVNDVANNLAAYMMNEMDVQPGDLVGLMCDRSHWLVICMLAIMKTGAAYVPLDPGFPEERLRYIAEDSGMKVLLQQSKFSGKDIFPGKTLHFDQALSNGSGSNRFPLINASSADTIYVIYTSGSTGKPKGVPITHRSVINLLNSVGNDLRFSSADCFLAVTSYSFDISVLELFLPLINGARLLLADSSVVSNAHLLQQLIEKEQPSVMQATPSLWKMLIESGWPGQTHLKVLCGGERLTPDLGLKLLERSAELYNMYGPTETTIWSTRKKITTAGELATIGTPVANTQVYITDNHTRLLPPGIAGELLIGGDGLSTGYHNRESLTREKFIANPFRENSTLYRTGDIARWLPNGEIEFLGRNDEQVKVRGYRIELGEIEDILQQHPRVKEAVVLLKKWEQEESLVAYYTSEETLATEELISFLMRSLPVFMIPSYFVYLKAMPQTPNGKTDRKALPLPVELHTEESGYAPAETALQEKLVIMWQDILGREKIGRTANFFEMGGHSLKATRLMSRIYKELGIRPEIRNIFTYPVLENFAAAIDQDNVATSLPIALLEPAADYALSPVQEQMWVMNQFEAERFSYIIPAAFWLHGRIDIAAFTRSLETLAERHEILRTVFVITGGEPRQKILTVREMNFRTTYTDISTQPDKDALAAEMAGNEAQTPMDLENGPLIRAGLIKVEEEKHLFLLTMHHIITDDWSMEVVVNEMFALYNSYSRGLNNPLPAIKIQYKEYAAWQLEMLKQRSAEHLQFWLQQFSRPVPLPDLRPDYTDVTVKTGRAEEIIFTCSKAVKDELTAVAGANDATLYMALLAAINVYLSAYTGQTDIVIGTPYAGREHPELENQLGPYLNTLALRTAFNREIYFDDLVKTIKDNLLNSIQHGMFPMNKVIHALQQKSGVQGLYLFNVGFTWHNTAGILDESDTAAVTDFTIEDFQSEAQRVKTDFWFHAWEGTEEVRFSFLYNADLFKRSSMMSLVEDLKLLLATIRSGTLQPIGNLVSLIEENKKNKLFMEKQDAHDRNLKKFFGAAPKKAGDAVAVLVKESLLENGQPYPVVIKPALNGLILDQWAKENVAWLKQKLTQTGALLLRGFHVPDIAAFREFANAFSEDLMNYMDQSSPRTLVGEKLYTSTDHPADQVIHMHNELSYSQTWPLQIMFHCVQPPEEGGETPVCDTRRILDLLSEKTKADFAEKGIMYTRNIREGFGLSWQDVYQTTSREVVEEYCKNHDIRYTWVNDNRLQISWNGPAILDHPVTGEKVWFNHGFFFNEFALDNEIRKMVGNQDDLPFNTLYGDGTPIPEEVIREIGSAYAGTRKIFTWEKGDVLLLDNMLMSHGRNAFSGKRKIVVAMSNPYSLAAVNIPS